MMRYLVPLTALLLIGCSQGQSDATRIGERTFRIESPSIPGGATGPNQRVATQLCPGGYRLLSSEAHKGGKDRVDSYDFGTTTTWVIKCI